MHNWITPVTDRTQSDIDYAIQKLAEWSQMENPPTTKLKGCLNDSDLNRICNNILYIRERMHAVQSVVLPSAVRTTYSTSSYIGLFELNGILNVVIQYNQIIGISTYNFRPLTDYSAVNILESCLEELGIITDESLALSRYAGTSYANGMEVLTEWQLVSNT